MWSAPLIVCSAPCEPFTAISGAAFAVDQEDPSGAPGSEVAVGCAYGYAAPAAAAAERRYVCTQGVWDLHSVDGAAWAEDADPPALVCEDVDDCPADACGSGVTPTAQGACVDNGVDAWLCNCAPGFMDDPAVDGDDCELSVGANNPCQRTSDDTAFDGPCVNGVDDNADDVCGLDDTNQGIGGCHDANGCLDNDGVEVAGVYYSCRCQPEFTGTNCEVAKPCVAFEFAADAAANRVAGNGEVGDPCADGGAHGSVCSLSCAPGFESQGDMSVTCSYGAWQEGGGACVEIPCSALDAVPTLYVNAEMALLTNTCTGTRAVGETCQLGCDYGYTFATADLTLACAAGADGQPSFGEPQKHGVSYCTLADCPADAVHGESDDTCRCDRGYATAEHPYSGENELVFDHPDDDRFPLRSGVWSGACAEAACPAHAARDAAGGDCACEPKFGGAIEWVGNAGVWSGNCVLVQCPAGATNSAAEPDCVCVDGLEDVDDPLTWSAGQWYGACTDADECGFTGSAGAADEAVCTWTGTGGAGMGCTNTEGGYLCSCPDGYEPDGDACADIDECAGSAPCQAGIATCVNNDGGHTCVCNAGYEPSDAGAVAGDAEFNVCVSIDECGGGADVCNAYATCVELSGFQDLDGEPCEDETDATCYAGYRCDCLAGAEKRCDAADAADPDCIHKAACADIDECAAFGALSAADGARGCATVAFASGDDAALQCLNADMGPAAPLGFSCGACPAGLAGDGVVPFDYDGDGEVGAAEGAGCANINECTLGQGQRGCDTSATCTDYDPTASSDRDDHAATFFDCGCPNGWGGEGFEMLYTVGGAYEAAPGVSAAAPACEDPLDDCLDDGTDASWADPCPAFSDCANGYGRGNFECNCHAGFAMQADAAGNDACVEVDECGATPPPCWGALACTEVAPPVGGGKGHECAECPDGYEGALASDGSRERGDSMEPPWNSGGCADVNECEAGTDECTGVGTLCQNTAGGYTCRCAAGYVFASLARGCLFGNRTETCRWGDSRSRTHGPRPVPPTNGPPPVLLRTPHIT